jgi:hypothetical protein
LFSGLSLRIIAAAMAWLILASNAMTVTASMGMAAPLVAKSRSAVMASSRPMKSAMTAMNRIEMVVSVIVV